MEGQVKLHLEVENVDELDLTIYRSNGLAPHEEPMPDENFNPEVVAMVIGIILQKNSLKIF